MKTSKNMTNLEIAELLEDVAASYQIKDANKNRFKIIAYQRASVAIEHLSSEAKDLWDEGKLEEVGGIGKHISEHLGEIFDTGKSNHFEKVMKGIPPVTFEMMKLSGIGPKTSYKLAKKFDIKELKDLEKLANEGKIAELEGFGEESQQAILESVSKQRKKKKTKKRLLIGYAGKRADEIVDWMKKSKYSLEVETLGSIRRKVSTIGDIDIVVATNNPENTIEHLVDYPKKTKIVEKGTAEASILIPGDLEVNLKVITPDSFGSMLQHFTGSKQHNIKLREYAQKKKLSLSEYGIKKGKVLKKYKNEQEFYKALGMDWIPPELREDQGEIEKALNNKIPKLLELLDIKADLQIHSDFDIETSHDVGASSMENIIKKANELGYEYIAFTEHNPSKSKHNEKQITDLIKRKKDKIDKINYSITEEKKGSVQYVFNSLEVDMLPKGGLPLPNKAFEYLDFALVSIHSSFDLSKSDMTKRVVSSLAHPKAKIFAHPTARILNKREGVELDWEKIFDFCVKNKKFIEINADSARLDLPDFLIKEAIDAGVKLSMGTDAHHVDGLDNMPFGVWNARRGWATKKDIINTRNLSEFRGMIES